MEAPTRNGAKENGPTASSAPMATASVPARFRAVRRFMGAAESTGYCLLAVASWRYEPGTGQRRGTLGDAGMPVNKGSTEAVRPLVRVSAYNRSRSVTTPTDLDQRNTVSYARVRVRRGPAEVAACATCTDCSRRPRRPVLAAGWHTAHSPAEPDLGLYMPLMPGKALWRGSLSGTMVKHSGWGFHAR